MKVTVKSYLYALGHSGEFTAYLRDGALFRDLARFAAERFPSLAGLVENVEQNRIIALRNSEKIVSGDLPLSDGDKIMLIDGSFGG